MPVYTLTVRIADADGQVTAEKRAPFFVCDSAEEDLEKAAADLEKAAADLSRAAHDLVEAAKAESHPKHHKWRP